MKQKITRTLRSVRMIVVGLLVSAEADATAITFNLSQLTGNTYVYQYTVFNDSLRVALEAFQVFFPNADNLNIVSDSSIGALWDEVILGTTLTDPSVYDALADPGPAIAQGNSVTGFAVQFTWNEAGIPGNQAFEVYDPTTFEVLDSGQTQQVNQISEPSTILLFGSGLLGFAAGAYDRRRKYYG